MLRGSRLRALLCLALVAWQASVARGQSCSATSNLQSVGLNYDTEQGMARPELARPSSSCSLSSQDLSFCYTADSLRIEYALLNTSTTGTADQAAVVLLGTSRPASAAECSASCFQLTGRAVNASLRSLGATSCNIWTWCASSLSKSAGEGCVDRGSAVGCGSTAGLYTSVCSEKQVLVISAADGTQVWDSQGMLRASPGVHKPCSTTGCWSVHHCFPAGSQLR